MTLPKPPAVPLSPLVFINAALKHLSDPNTTPATRIRFARSNLLVARHAFEPPCSTVEATLRASLDQDSYSNTPDGIKALLEALEAAGLVLVFK